MSIQIVNKGAIIPKQSNTSIAPIDTKFPIVPIQPILQSLDPFSKLSKSETISALTAKQLQEAREATTILPNSVSNLDMQIDILSKIDISDPNSYEIITPTNIINYYEHYYGGVDMEILETDELISSEPSDIDISSLSIDITRNTSLDFILFDPAMAFLTSNGTLPENLVVAQNISEIGENHSVLLSLNQNSEQNKAVIKSTELQTISIAVDIPLGLDAIQLSDFIIDISNRTETLQIISPDLVTETSYDEESELLSFDFYTDAVKNPVRNSRFSQQPKGNLPKFFGDLPVSEIRMMLETPSDRHISKFRSSKGISGGKFFLGMHGRMLTSEMQDYDCDGYDRLAFIGRHGLLLGLDADALLKWSSKSSNAKLGIKSKKQRVVGNICRMPKIVFNAETDNVEHATFGLKHIDENGTISNILTNYDMIQIFGDDDIPFHALLNLVRYISKSQTIHLDIAACLAVPQINKNTEFTSFSIGNSQKDIPQYFHIKPKKIVPIDVPREKGIAQDRFCRLGASKMDTSVENDCEQFVADEVIKVHRIDPNVGISGEGINAALSDKELQPHIKVLFKVRYTYPNYMHGKNKIAIRGDHFVLLKGWHRAGWMTRFLNSEEYKTLRLPPAISISDIIPEINDVFHSFKPDEVISHKDFITRLLKKLKSNLPQISRRL